MALKWKTKGAKSDYLYMSSDAISFWRLQDSLLQSYRGLFLTATSILLASSGLFLINSDKGQLVSFFGLFEIQNFNFFSIAFLVVGFLVCFIWDEVAKRREDAVFFFEYLLLELEKGKKIYGVMETFMNFGRASNNERQIFLKPFMDARDEKNRPKGSGVNIRTSLHALPRIFKWAFIIFFAVNLFQILPKQ